MYGVEFMEKNSRKLNLLWWIPLLFIGIGVASLLCCFYKLGFTDLIFTEDFKYYGVYKIVIVASIVLIASSFVFLILSLVFKRKNTVQIIICIAMALCYVGILTPTVINSVNSYKSVEINYYTKSDIKNISVIKNRELNIKVMKQDDTTIVIANTNDNNDEFCYHYIDSQNENLYMVYAIREQQDGY